MFTHTPDHINNGKKETKKNEVVMRHLTRTMRLMEVNVSSTAFLKMENIFCFQMSLFSVTRTHFLLQITRRNYSNLSHQFYFVHELFYK